MTSNARHLPKWGRSDTFLIFNLLPISIYSQSPHQERRFAQHIGLQKGNDLHQKFRHFKHTHTHRKRKRAYRSIVWKIACAIIPRRCRISFKHIREHRYTQWRRMPTYIHFTSCPPIIIQNNEKDDSVPWAPNTNTQQSLERTLRFDFHLCWALNGLCALWSSSYIGAYGFCDRRFAFNISSTSIWCVWTCMRWKAISNSGSNRVHACMKLTYMSIACWLLWEFNGNAWRAFRHLCEPPPICIYTSRLFACGYLQF